MIMSCQNRRPVGRWPGFFLAGCTACLLATPARASWRVSNPEPLTRSGTAVSPSISPDGRRVAYVVGTRLQVTGGPDAISGRVWMLDRASRLAERIGRLNVDLVAGETSAVFAPDGAYAYIEGPRSSPILWYVDADGTRFQVDNGRSASFSPDGRYLAYTVWHRDTKPVVELRLFDTRSRESKSLNRTTVKTLPVWAKPPVWSPNAERIHFLADSHLWSYARYTGRTTAVVRTGDVADFDVVDNDRVVFYRHSAESGDGGIWMARVDGRSLARLIASEELPSRIAQLMAAPDGTGVLFIADTARGRGLVIADLRTHRWRYASAADGAALQAGGSMLVLEVPGPDNKRNVAAATLSYRPDTLVPESTGARLPGAMTKSSTTRANRGE